MLCREVTDIIEQRFPKEYALDWDNVGLLAGRDDKEVRCIYIALDASDEVIHTAAQQGADMLVTHHPLIFSGMKRITNQDFIGRRILGLIRRDISYYAMHTNYDVLGMAALSGSMIGLKQPEALEVTCEAQEGIGRIGQLEKAVSLRQCCEDVKSMIGAALKAQADVLITGDIGHHEGIDAAAQGMAVIDAGHYGLEHIFVEDMKDYLGKKLEGVQIITAPVCHPFVNI